MNSSIVLGVIFVLLAAVEIGAAYHLRASKERAGGGLTIGAVITLSLGVLFLIQHAKTGIGMAIVAVAQVIAVATLVKLVRDRADREDDDDQPPQAVPYGVQPGAHGAPSPPPGYGGPVPPQQR